AARRLWEHPDLRQGRGHPTGGAGASHGLSELLLRHPCVGVGHNGHVPIPRDLRSRVHRRRAVEKARDVVALDHAEAVDAAPHVLPHPCPDLVAVTAVVSARDKYGDRLLAELRVEREPVAVDVPPDGVLTVVGRRDALLVLVAAAKLWVDHIHERVIRQPRAVYTEREVLVEAAPLAEGT